MVNQLPAEITKELVAALVGEGAKSVLEIGGGSALCGALAEACGASFHSILINPSEPDWFSELSRKLTGEAASYDVIVVTNLIECLPPDDAKLLLKFLLTRARAQVLLAIRQELSEIPPEYCHLSFLGFDYSALQKELEGVSWLLFSVFPRKKTPLNPADRAHEPFGARRRLKLAYVLPHRNLTGGIKALLAQMSALSRAGHRVSAYYRGAPGEGVLPAWGNLPTEQLYSQTLVPRGESYIKYIADADIIILGWMSQVPEFIGSRIPVALWEQGSEPLFGDYYGALVTSNAPLRMSLRQYYSAPVHLLAVSAIVQKVLKSVYGREALIFPAIIDTEFYHPVQRLQNDPPVILLVGYSFLSFKGFDWALEVLGRLAQTGERFRVCWAAPAEFEPPSGLPFELTKYIGLPQETLAQLYTKTDVLFSASRYEALSLPPLEAMSSGACVLMTDCGGCNMYARDGENCILIKQGDAKAAVTALRRLLSDMKLKQRITKNGRETALKFSSERIVKILEDSLYSIL
jgi:glycosyltransferase involved in cell wall biosynthesis